MQKMNCVLILALVTFAVSPPCYAQWAIAYGYDSHDNASSVCETSDGGYVVAGYTTESVLAYIFDYDYWVLKLDSDGSIEWQKTYGMSGHDYDKAWAVQETWDGGYLVAGHTGSFFANDWDFWILKLDSDGNIDWQKTYGGTDYDHASSIQGTSDGGYLVAGYTQSFGAGGCDFWILKLDSEGDVDWQRTYGGNTLDMASSIRGTSDGGYVVAGFTFSFGAGGKDSWVLKLDSDGSIDWQKTYGGTDYDDHASSVCETSDGGYVVAGSSRSFGAGGNDSWVLKLDSDGSVVWQKTYGGSGDDSASSVCETSDDGYVVAGSSRSFGAGNPDFWVLKLNSSGEIPGCSIMSDSHAVVTNTNASVGNTSVFPQNLSVPVRDTSVVPRDTNAEVDVVCDGENVCESDHFRIYITNSGTGDPTELADFLEDAYELYGEWDFLQGRSLKKEHPPEFADKYSVFLVDSIPLFACIPLPKSDKFGATFMHCCNLGCGIPSATYVKILNMLPDDVLEKTAVHEYFHAVQSNYVPGLTVQALGPKWPYDGTADMMSSIVPDYPDDRFVSRMLDIPREPYKDLRSQKYGSSLYWYFIARNQRIDFNGHGQRDSNNNWINIDVIEKFWNILYTKGDWGPTNQPTNVEIADALDTAFANAKLYGGDESNKYNSFDKSFVEFSKANLFGDAYYLPAVCNPVDHSLVVNDADLDEANPICVFSSQADSEYPDAQVLEPIQNYGVHYFNIASFPDSAKKISVSFIGQTPGLPGPNVYFARGYESGAMDNEEILDGILFDRKINADFALNTKYITGRSSQLGTGDFQIFFQLITDDSMLVYTPRCPVDIVVSDPDGLLTKKDARGIADSIYLEFDMDSDGDDEDRVTITNRKLGHYKVEVVPEAGANPTDTYTLEVSSGDRTIVLAENVPISEIPDEPYTIVSTEEGIEKKTWEQCKLELSTGWNLISLPLEESSRDPEVILSSIDGKYNSVWHYDGDTGWKIYVPDGVSDLIEIVPGMGYWIEMDEAADLIIQGTIIKQTGISLKGGEWNLVGYSSTEPKNAEDCMKSVENDINSVWEYGPHDAVEKNWSIYVPGGLSGLELMKPGYGYWIKADRDCPWDINSTNP